MESSVMGYLLRETIGRGKGNLGSCHSKEKVWIDKGCSEARALLGESCLGWVQLGSVPSMPVTGWHAQRYMDSTQTCSVVLYPTLS